MPSKKESIQEQQGDRPGELLVKFREGSSENARNIIALSHGSRRGKKLRGESALEKMDVPAGQSAETFARLLASNPAVEFAEANFLIKRDQFQTEESEGISVVTVPWLRKPSASTFPPSFNKHPGGSDSINPGPPGVASAGKFPTGYLRPQAGLETNDPRFNEQWALRNTGQSGGQLGSDINVTAAWQTTTGSPSTVVAVIDSGIDFTHPDLSNNQWTNPAPAPEGDLHGWDYITDAATITDEQGHGTSIAGIIAAQGNNANGISGVMWRASLMSLRVLDNTGTGEIADAVEAIDYAVAHNAQVINISWGTTGASIALKDSLERAIRRGVVVVCSAGNGGQDVEQTPYYPASFNIRDLIVVASTDHFDQLPSWSNWGRRRVTVAAPGTNILTTQMGGSYWQATGTSASAPLVSGVAGLIKAARPWLEVRKIEKAISDGARQVASLSGKVAAGGVVDAAAALRNLHGSGNPPLRPPTPGHGSGGTGPGGTFSTTPPPRTTGAPGGNLPNLDQIRRAQPTRPAPQAPIQSNLMCADCDPQGGGGGGGYYPSGDPNFSTAREHPRNETGQPGVDLGSRNFNWSLPLVSLAGRAGLDLNLTLVYNSLVWTKDGSYIKYNADLGSPAPGFRLGLPTLQQRFLNSQTEIHAYMMVTSSGSRVEMRQVGSSNIYESQDGSYTQLDVSNPNAPLVRTTDGTQLSFSPAGINSEYRCNHIQDRNGNYISATYDPNNGHLLTITDTLSRVITFVRDGNGNLTSIRQTWAGVAHDWATFSYGEVYVAPNFGGGLLVNGPNNNYVTVLTQVSTHDGSYFTFNYNAPFGQVNKINHYDPDTNLRSYVSYNLDASAGQTDCPRFTERRDKAVSWNNNAEAVTTYLVAGDASWSQQTAPDGTIYKELFYTSGWQSGLSYQSEIWSGGVRQKWTTTAWTQDDESLLYQKNPRPYDISIYDQAGNRRRMDITYTSYSLPYEIREYAADGSSFQRRTYIDYRFDAGYIDRRIIGLRSAEHVMDENNQWVSKITYEYDWDNTNNTYLINQGAATQHDGINYSQSFIGGRGNLCAVRRWNVAAINDGNQAMWVSFTGYNTTGSVIFSADGLGHETRIGYADSFSDGVSRSTYAYPTTVTDAGGFSSFAQYNYDFGAVTRTQDPKGAVQTMTYDWAGRIERVTTSNTGAYTHYFYGPTYTQSFSSINGIAQDFHEADLYLAHFFDGAGRLTATAQNHPGSSGTYSAAVTVYDVMGRVSQQSNPAEITAEGAPTGDDAAGWVWTYQSHDWRGRPLLTTNPDGTTTEASYGGCGCAGGEVTTVRDERGRRRRLTKDVLGRLKQVDELNWDQSVYATTIHSYNARDQITNINQAGQTRSFVYDGHGRLQNRITPEQGTMTYSYFGDDDLQTVTDLRGAATNFSYNNRGLVTGITYGVPEGVAATPNVSFGYDDAGNRTSMTDGLGSVSYSYNTLSQLTSETRTFTGVGSYTLSYAYNLGGELTSITNPWNAQVGYSYDRVGRPTGVSGANYAGVSSYVNSIAYRAFGMKQMAYGNGKTLSLSYDNRLRLTGWDIPGVMGWSYAYATPAIPENTQRVAFANNLYDHTLDRSYDYDAVGRMWASHTGVEGRGHAGYGEWGTADGPYAENYSFDQVGNMTWRNGWGVTNAQYNHAPQFVNNRMTVNPVTGASIQYDAAGNLTNDGSQSYSYDATGQQSYASGVSGGGGAPAFTPPDPLVAGVEIKAVHITELRAAINQVRAGVGLAAATWAEAIVAGETTVKADHVVEMRIALDQALGAPTPAYSEGLAQGLPILAIHLQELRERIKAALGSSALNQYYDGDRLRVKKTEYGATTFYVRSSVLGGQVVAELGASGNWTRGYVYLGGQMLAIQSGGSVNWVHQDPVTKSQRITNSSGAVITTIDLDPWGGETGRSSNQAFQPHRYTTYERDANGGDEAMHRRYQSSLTRFSQPDPYDGSYNLGDPQSFNRYAYVQNDPVNFVDPTGTEPCIPGNTSAECGWGGFGGWGGGFNLNDRVSALGGSGQQTIYWAEHDFDHWLHPEDTPRYIDSAFSSFSWSGFFGAARGGGRSPQKPAPTRPTKPPCNDVGSGQGDVNVGRTLGGSPVGPTGGLIVTNKKIYPYGGVALGRSPTQWAGSLMVRNGRDVSPGLNYSLSIGSVIGIQYSGKLDLNNIRSSLTSGRFSAGGTMPQASVSLTWVFEPFNLPCGR